MNLLFLHGPPAAGKLTVAKAIHNRAGGKLADNHASIDLARHLFEFGTEDFWDLVLEVRCLMIEKAARARVPLFINTFCYSEPQDRLVFERFESILARHGGQVLPVFLRCSPEALRARIGAPERVSRRKLTSVEGLNQTLAKWNFAPVPRSDCLSIDSEQNAPEVTAEMIIKHFKIASGG